jgi:hypothetical protein
MSRTRSCFVTLATLLAVPLLMGAKGPGCGGEVSIGDDKTEKTECPTASCGGMPAIACWDGSSPYTGKCLSKGDGTCGWEERACPTKTECSPCAAPVLACADGTSPYSGKCYLDATGACMAEYKGCSDGSCDKSECGPALGMASWTCEDGTIGGNTGRCLRKAGKCGWEVIDCPRKCTDSECGAPPPVAACGDGTTPSVECKRKTDGTCGWNVGACAVTACQKVEAYPRACTGKSDCTFGLHQTNCCGSERAMGYTKSAAATFGADEKACEATYPGCGCAASPTVDDSGKTGTAFDVDCVAGSCTTYVTATL